MYFKATLFLVIIANLTGCYHHIPSCSVAQDVKALPDYISRDFNYPANKHELTSTSKSSTSSFNLTEYTFSSTLDLLSPEQQLHKINFEIYSPKKAKYKTTILSLPISGGNYQVSRYFARYFAKEGYTTIIIKRRKVYKNMITVETINTIIRQMIIDHKQVMDKVIEQNLVSSNNFAVIGVSKGGLKTALLSALDNRVRAGIIVIAGGDLPFILTKSQEKGVKKRRLKYLQKTGMSNLEFHDALKENLKYDPLTLAPYFNSKNILIVNAYFDNCVPYYSGKLLVEAHKGCEEILLLAGHYSALPSIPYLAIKFKSFLDRKLTDQ